MIFQDPTGHVIPAGVFFLREVQQFASTLGDPEDFAPMGVEDLQETYTNSLSYLYYLTQFHNTPPVRDALDLVYERSSKSATVLDVGCAAGFSGLRFALLGHHVIFHDFEGLGLDFIRWISERYKLDTRVIPYGERPPRSDLLLAVDVIEHTPNQLGFVHWVGELGRSVFLTYPHATAFRPPYEIVIDQWMDGEAMEMIIMHRYPNAEIWREESRTYMLYNT